MGSKRLVTLFVTGEPAGLRPAGERFMSAHGVQSRLRGYERRLPKLGPLRKFPPLRSRKAAQVSRKVPSSSTAPTDSRYSPFQPPLAQFSRGPFAIGPSVVSGPLTFKKARPPSFWFLLYGFRLKPPCVATAR